jgi:hypothetical protein
MAISSLVVRAGIGSWGNIAHLITRGLDIGSQPPPPELWTPVPPVTTNWSGISGGADDWNPVTPSSNPWVAE